MTTWKQHKAGLMKNPKFKDAYDALEPEYRLANELINARIGKKMTQTEVAEKAGVSRTVIARLESGTTNPTLGTVSRVASILGKELKLVGSSH
ncbi:MAG TPA: helix-turn-helix transcriptional regulator [Candidatus Saccharimonadales bacterium]